MSEFNATAAAAAATVVATTTTTMSDILDFATRWMLRLGSVLVGIVAIAGGLLYSKQESLLYLPEVQGIPRHTRQNPQGYRNPTERGLQHWFNVKIPTSDGTRIHAWYILHPAALQSTTTTRKLPTLVFFHGNAGNIGLRLPNAAVMMQNLQCHVLLVEYRGYGDSDDGKPPTEEGLKKDAQAAYHWIATAGQMTATTTANNGDAGLPQPQQPHVTASSPQVETLGVKHFVDTQQLYLFGRSLGGAVAFSLAEYVVQQQQSSSSPPLPPVAGLLVENTFVNIDAMVDKIFPFLKSIKPYVLRIHWDSLKIASTLIRTPILYLAGAKDDLVPHQHMQQLYQTSLVVAANPSTHLHVIPNGTHNESWYQGGADYWKAIAQFFKATTAAGASTTTTTTTAASSGAGDAGAIPTMSQNYMDMAKGALSSSNNNNKKRSKQDKKQS